MAERDPRPPGDLPNEPAWARSGRIRSSGRMGAASDGGLFENERHDTIPPVSRARLRPWMVVAGLGVVTGAVLFLVIWGFGSRSTGKTPSATDAAAAPAAAVPATPKTPAKPATPAKPVIPATPMTPAIPAPPVAPAIPSTPGTPATPAKPRREKVTLEFSVVPPHSAIDVDGRAVDGGRISVPRGSKALKVHIASPGYVTKTLHVVPDKDRQVAAQLDKK